MLSMTGYGNGEYNSEGVRLTVEIKTVNNRYLDVSVKAPRIFAAHEETVRGIIRGKLTRGHADVYISYTDSRPREKTYSLDENTARAYVGAAEKVAAMFPGLQNDVTVSSVLRFPEALCADDSVSADGELVSAMETALNAALDKLNSMRGIEGEKLKKDMLSRIDVIEETVGEVEKRAPEVVRNYALKLEAKISAVLGGVETDKARILTEAAVFADKCNIDEELTRLKSHIGQFRTICGEKLVGRKLDFLVQEFNRETNTICSKSNDLEITRLGLALKNEIEKIREQVQNVE